MNLEKLLDHQIPAPPHALVARDAILYALGIGYGDRPTDPMDLNVLYEQSPSFEVVPSMVNVIGSPGLWVAAPELDIQWLSMLHGEQRFEILKPLRAGITYIPKTYVRGVADKGAEKGALMLVRKELREQASGEMASIVDSTYFLRKDGGCGSTGDSAPPPHGIPQRAPDTTVEFRTLPQAALIYRLSGDYNPLHIDPAQASRAGFDAPILHGLCSLGVATRAVLQAAAGGVTHKLQTLQLRFSAPAYPGETLTTDIWIEGHKVSFQTRSKDRDVVILGNGLATLAA